MNITLEDVQEFIATLGYDWEKEYIRKRGNKVVVAEKFEDVKHSMGNGSNYIKTFILYEKNKKKFKLNSKRKPLEVSFQIGSKSFNIWELVDVNGEKVYYLTRNLSMEWQNFVASRHKVEIDDSKPLEEAPKTKRLTRCKSEKQSCSKIDDSKPLDEVSQIPQKSKRCSKKKGNDTYEIDDGQLL